MQKFWERIAEFLYSLMLKKIYQDGLPVDGEEGAKSGSQNYEIILNLLNKEIRETEAPRLA